MAVYLYKSSDYKIIEKIVEAFSLTTWNILQSHHAEKNSTIEQAANASLWFNPTLWEQISKHYAALHIAMFSSKAKLQLGQEKVSAQGKLIRAKSTYEEEIYKKSSELKEKMLSLLSSSSNIKKSSLKNATDFSGSLMFISKLPELASLFVKIFLEDEHHYLEDLQNFFIESHQMLTENKNLSPRLQESLKMAVELTQKQLKETSAVAEPIAMPIVNTEEEAEAVLKTAYLAFLSIENHNDPDIREPARQAWNNFYASIKSNEKDDSLGHMNLIRSFAQNLNIGGNIKAEINGHILQEDHAATSCHEIAPGIIEEHSQETRHKEFMFQFVYNKIENMKKYLHDEKSKLSEEHYETMSKLENNFHAIVDLSSVQTLATFSRVTEVDFAKEMSTIMARLEIFLQTTLYNLNTLELIKHFNMVKNYVTYLKVKLENNSVPKTKVEMLIENFCTELSEKLAHDVKDDKTTAMYSLIEELNTMRQDIRIKNDNLDEIIHHDVEIYLNLLHNLHGNKSYLEWAKTQRSTFFSTKKAKTQVMIESLVKNLKTIKNTVLQMEIDTFHEYTQEHLDALQKATANEIYTELCNYKNPINFTGVSLNYLEMCNLSIEYLKFKLNNSPLGHFIADLIKIIEQEKDFTLKSTVHEKLMTSKITKQRCSARIHNITIHKQNVQRIIGDIPETTAKFISNPTLGNPHHIPVSVTETAF